MFYPLSCTLRALCCCGLGSDVRRCWHDLEVFNPFTDAICTMMESQEREKRACTRCRADPHQHPDAGHLPWVLAELRSMGWRDTWAVPPRSPGCHWGQRSPALALHSCFNIGRARLSPKEDKAANMQGSPMPPKMGKERGNNFLWEFLSYVLCQPYAGDFSSTHPSGRFLPFGMWGINPTHCAWSHLKLFQYLINVATGLYTGHTLFQQREER